MQLKRDTEYAMRIMDCYLQGEKRASVSFSLYSENGDTTVQGCFLPIPRESNRRSACLLCNLRPD